MGTSWWSDPEKRESATRKMREASLRKWRDPEYRRRLSEAHREYARVHPEEVARRTQRMRERQTLASHRKSAEKLMRWLAIPENRQKQLESVQKALEDPEMRRRRGKAVLAAKRTPEARRKARENALKNFNYAKHRERTRNMPKRSKYEDQVQEYVASIYTGPIQRQAHVFPDNPKSELDIYLPDLRIGIEVQGDFYHSKPEVRRLDQKKQERCLDMGISLFVLWVSDWKTRYSDEREATEQALKSFLQLRMDNPEADPDIAFSHEDVPLFFGGVEQGPIEGLH